MKRTKEFTTPQKQAQEQEHLASTMLAQTQRAVTESNHYSDGEIASESDSDGEWKVLSTPTSPLGQRAQVTSDSDSNGQPTPPLKSEPESEPEPEPEQSISLTAEQQQVERVSELVAESPPAQTLLQQPVELMLTQPAALPPAQQEQQPNLASDFDSNGVSAPLLELAWELETGLGQPSQLLPNGPGAGSNLQSYMLTGLGVLAVAAICYVSQDEFCALLIGYDEGCSLNSVFGHGW